jgi:hypothetical protein
VKKKSQALKKIKVMLDRVVKGDSVFGGRVSSVNADAAAKLVLPGIATR